jgi:peptidoglycan hydrolase CwlO-like protein
MAIAIAATSLVLTLVMGFLLYLEIHKMEKQILEIQEQIHHLNNDVSRVKQQIKKQYYSGQNKRQVIKG